MRVRIHDVAPFAEVVYYQCTEMLTWKVGEVNKLLLMVRVLLSHWLPLLPVRVSRLLLPLDVPVTLTSKVRTVAPYM